MKGKRKVCYRVASTSMHIHSTPWSSRGHEGEKKRKIQPRSAIPFCGLVTVATGRHQLDRKCHALTSIIQHLSFSSPPLCYLFNGRQHMGHTGPMRLQQNTATCLTRGTTKAGGVGTWATLPLPEHPSTDWAALAFKTCRCTSSATKGNFGKAVCIRLSVSNWTRVKHLGVFTFTETLPVECLPLCLHTAVSGISVWSGLHGQQL